MRQGSKIAVRGMALLGLVGAAFAVRSVSATAQPQTPVFVHVTPVKEVNAVIGASTTIVVKITIDKGYHLQGHDAKDPYIPTAATVQAPEGVTVGKIMYSPSVKKDFSGETLPVYESKVEIRIPISIAKTAKPGDLKLPVTVNYQGCNDKACFPPTKLTSDVAIKVAAR